MAAPDDRQGQRRWLSAVFLMIVLMTAVGGTTRLTGSGLSMVVWEPFIGAVPPIGAAAWERVFDQYKQTPQYQEVNAWMQLADFQRIFFWEYVHRLLGRTIGSVVLLPALWFLWRRQLSRALGLRTLAMLALGGGQGLLGWYMVQSGLIDVPRVSHFRLASHLLLAFLVAQLVLWVRLSLDPPRPGATPLAPGLRGALLGFGALLLLQTTYGAFVAGLKAGHFADTFPDVHGHYLPTAFAGSRGLIDALLYEPGAIHATHRLLAWIALALGLALVGALRQGPLRREAGWLGGLLLLQVLLGALTVVLHVPTALAVAHQVNGLLLLSAVTLLLERGRRGPGFAPLR
jgi:heme a synthase